MPGNNRGFFDVIMSIRWLREQALIQTSVGNPAYLGEGLLYDTTRHIILLV